MPAHKNVSEEKKSAHTQHNEQVVVVVVVGVVGVLIIVVVPLLVKRITDNMLHISYQYLARVFAVMFSRAPP